MNRPAGLKEVLAPAGARHSLLGFLNGDSGAALAAASRNMRGFTLEHQARFGFPFVNKVRVIAGATRQRGAAEGRGAAARFHYPQGIAVGPDGALYVADQMNHTIRMISPSGDVTTLAGAAGQPGTADGAGAAARFNLPMGVAVGPDGSVYVADSGNGTIRVIRGGVVTTLAGTAGRHWYDPIDGRGPAAHFRSPKDVAVGPDGTVYVTDNRSHTIRMIRGDLVTTLAGAFGRSGAIDGVGGAARFNDPCGIAVGPDGTVYVADTGNQIIRMIRGNVVTTLAGALGEVGADDGRGVAARFSTPYGVAVGPDGAVYVADLFNKTIRIIRGDDVTTLEGTPGAGQPFNPTSLAVGPDGTVYVSESNNHTISKIQNNLPPLRNFNRERAAAAAARGGKRKTIKKRKNNRKTRRR